MMNYLLSCAIFGHRDIEITDKLITDIKNCFIDLITNYNVWIFYFGGFGMFDDLCWQILTELKHSTFPDLKRIYVCENQTFVDRPHKRPKWVNSDNYEEIVYFALDFEYWYTSIYYRNIAIIDHSDFNIFYIRNTQNSGAYKAYKYAKKRKKNLILI